MNTHARPSQLQIHNTIQSQGVAAGLYWVRKELTQNLQLASQLVEQHSEHRQDSAVLTKALAHLHEVRGAAVLIQAYGLALLAEEMKQTVQELASGVVHEPDPAYSAIVGACVQAVDYLDLLQNGQTDSALVLQPIVNELRLARGKSLLTEDDLFVRPAALYAIVHRYTAPFALLGEEQVLRDIGEGMRDDMAQARQRRPAAVLPAGAIYVLPDATWSRRVRGVFGNELATAEPDRAHAVLSPDAQGGYTVSVRAPSAAPRGADSLCREFPTGSGRSAAAGINHLPRESLPEFIRAFGRVFSAATDSV